MALVIEHRNRTIHFEISSAYGPHKGQKRGLADFGFAVRLRGCASALERKLQKGTRAVLPGYRIDPVPRMLPGVGSRLSASLAQARAGYNTRKIHEHSGYRLAVARGEVARQLAWAVIG